MKKVLLFAIMVMMVSCTTTKKGAPEKIESVEIIPQPQKITMHSGHFMLNQQTKIVLANTDKKLKETARFFAQYLSNGLTQSLKIEESGAVDAKNAIVLQTGISSIADEGYILKISEKNILIQAKKATGIFYGFQTLRQLLPAHFEKNAFPLAKGVKLKNVLIEDAPRFEWRGGMLDVARHMFPVSFIKRYIDILAMHKLNTFHWHLTEDQGWRIEIKKYPKLASEAAYREQTMIGHHSDRPRRFDGKRYGGVYTQQEVKEIVAYAAERFITVVPEIEMPGHSIAALKAYPNLSCTGGPHKTREIWGIEKDIYCAGNDSTFIFLQNVLSEVFTLFPSKYIHVGGDEAPKARWDACAKCQKRIVDEGLHDSHELQSYFITRMEKFINKNGRKLIGWDEILEGGLAPNAAVMSWRGVKGGIEAAKAGHKVVMSPTTYCYFDYYQGEKEYEPIAIGGYLPISKVYAFDPVPEGFTEEEAQWIMGGQANLWTEYIPTPKKAEYMLLPRLAALSEAVWSQKQNRSWNSFSKRILTLLKRYDALGLNYAKSMFAVRIKPQYSSKKEKLLFSMGSEIKTNRINYTLDGSDPNPESETYKNPIEISQNSIIKAASFKDGKRSHIARADVALHKAFGKGVKTVHPAHAKYPASGNYALTDGLTGGNAYYDGKYQGYYKNDLIADVDLDKETEISHIEIACVQGINSWVFMPKEVVFYVSDDGSNFKQIASVKHNIDPKSEDYVRYVFAAKALKEKARYIRVHVKNFGACPPWHQGAGGATWLFADEIIVK